MDEHVEIVEQKKVKENHMMLMWQVVNLELWLRQLREGGETDSQMEHRG